MDLGVVLGHVRLHEGVVGDGEGQSVQTLELELEEGVRSVYDRVDGLALLLDRLNVLVEGLRLLALKFFEDVVSTLAPFDELLGERGHLARVNWMEDEVHDTSISTLDQTRFLASGLFSDH